MKCVEKENFIAAGGLLTEWLPEDGHDLRSTHSGNDASYGFGRDAWGNAGTLAAGDGH